MLEEYLEKQDARDRIIISYRLLIFVEQGFSTKIYNYTQSLPKGNLIFV
jgi:hypothetical protein